MSTPEKYREAAQIMTDRGTTAEVAGLIVRQAAADLDIALRALRSIHRHSDRHDVRRTLAREAVIAITGRKP